MAYRATLCNIVTCYIILLLKKGKYIEMGVIVGFGWVTQEVTEGEHCRRYGKALAGLARFFALGFVLRAVICGGWCDGMGPGGPGWWVVPW